MNSKNKNIMLFVCIFVVLVIFIDLIFNFSGIFIENFTSSAAPGYNAGSTSSGDSTTTSEPDISDIKSIVSKISGRVFNINFVQGSTNKITISSPSNPKIANLSVNGDGTLSEQTKASNNTPQSFKLHRITDIQSYRAVLPNNNGADIASTCTGRHYPFYIVKSEATGKEDWCLAYDTGNLFIQPIGNYDNQKWDLSKIVVDTKSFCVNNMDNTSTGQLRSEPDSSLDSRQNKDKIKINFNLNDELKSKLFGIEDSGNQNNAQQKCPTYLPKDSVNSLCKGCDIDRL
jgi:hypothetical protein